MAMPQRITPVTKTRVITQDGEVHMTIELELTLNLNINGTGEVVASATPNVKVIKEDDDKVELQIPDFTSGPKLDFGQKIDEAESKEKKGWSIFGK
jgi:hypothetical protein